MKKILSWILVVCLCLSACAAFAEDSGAAKITIDNIRDYVVGLDTPVTLPDGTSRPLINFDNAATTPALKPVMDEVNEKLLMYGSIGRGFSIKSNYSSELYSATRDKVLKFLNAGSGKYIVPLDRRQPRSSQNCGVRQPCADGRGA